ncbi:MAG: aminopeptidase P family protein [Spirochaetia bacterium]|nr:aminopeptidase P family protein [Spirochaetia bacterium]
MSSIPERLAALRKEMAAGQIEAYLIFGTDPHMSEYVAERWRDRAWISGFSGSAGTFVCTREKAGLWTDSRYYVQAAGELDGSGIALFRQGEADVPGICEWLGQELPREAVVGADGWTISAQLYRSFQQQLGVYGLELHASEDLLDRIWDGRPGLPEEDIYQHDLRYAGRSRQEKIEQLQQHLQELKADYQLLSSLSDIAWLFNLRGDDIKYNPLFLSYALIGKGGVHLCVDRGKLSEELTSLLEEEGVKIAPYKKVEELIQSTVRPDERVLYDPSTVSYALAEQVRWYARPVEKNDITTEMKAVKSSVEIEGIRNAMVKDGVAMVQFLYWLMHSWERGRLNEVSVGEALPQFRSRQPGFMGESFHPIVGFRDHGAVIHYSANESTAYELDGDGLLLIDSGAHYLDGTTDITRTVCLGEATAQQREDYTNVLKSHINLAMARFPQGTRGVQLETLAKYSMWSRGLNYTHGTGHGVGCFLNVHEGPQSISSRLIDAVLKPGMFNSNEPGLYRENAYGIRIENLILTGEQFETPFGRFYGFETLTLCPLEPRLIEPTMLSPEQLQWVNDYHHKVYTLLSPELKAEERRWLEQQTAVIS